MIMATVSEVKFMSDEEVGFCPCCGLRRPLGIVNVPGMPGQRCIDCFFGAPGESEFSFQGEAIWAARYHPTIGYGQTGDVVASWGPKYFFEPHGNPNGRVECNPQKLHAMRWYQPVQRRYPDYADEGFE